MSVPKIHLLYYKALLDRCCCSFFDENNDLFTKIDNHYVLSKNLSSTAIKRQFKVSLKEELLKYVKPYSALSPNYYFIIGACSPKENLLLDFKSGYFPEKLQKLIDADFPLKYVLKENDIKIDLVRFNSVMIELFNELFKSTRSVQRMLGNDLKNVMFIQHKRLDCYSMFKTLKWIFGTSNCVNLHQQFFKDDKQPLIAVNDLIDKYVQNKVAMNKSPEFKKIVQEVNQFIEEKLKEVHG